MSLGDFLEQKWLDHTFGNTPYVAPATIYVALFTTAPDDAGAGGVEVSGGSYARLAVTNNTTNWPNATGTTPTTKANGTSFLFGTATLAWGTVVAVSLYDAITGGNFLGGTLVNVAKAVGIGDQAEFPVGTLTITQS